MNDHFDEFFRNCSKNPPASPPMLGKVINKLPKSYTDFLSYSNGIEGVASNGSYLQLWKAEELEERNKDHLGSDIFVIGSDGGNEAIVIDMRKDSKTYGCYYRMPFIPLTWQEAVFLGCEVTDIKTD